MSPPTITKDNPEPLSDGAHPDGTRTSAPRKDDAEEGQVHPSPTDPEEEEHAENVLDDPVRPPSSPKEEDLDEMLANLDLETDFTTIISMDDCSVDSAAPGFPPGSANDSATAAGTNTSMDALECTEVVLHVNGDTSIFQHTAASSADGNHTGTASTASTQICWAQRLEREEVFSSHYRLSVAEEQELQDLEVEMGLKPKPGTTSNGKARLFSLGRGVSSRSSGLTEAQKVAWQRVARPSANPQQQQQQQQQPSLILKRGTCWLQPTILQMEQEQEEGSSSAAMVEQHECHVVLLTRGWAVAFASASSTSSTTATEYLYPFHNAWTWDEVEFVQPTQRGFMISLFNAQQPHHPRQLTLACAKLQERQDWMDAFYTVLVQYHTHLKSSPSHFPNNYVLGWQYQYVYRPGFTVAVTNRVSPDLEALDRQNAEKLNIIDEYHGFAPLHYAVKCHHVPAIVSLLQHPGIHVDEPDADGHSPLYLAVQDELPLATRQLLLDHGASPVHDYGPRGELFGKVAATEQILDERQRQKQQEQQAKVAQEEMANNMKLLQRRGEQINELNDKASTLNQGAADYASMAKQLKAAAQKKKWYHF